MNRIWCDNNKMFLWQTFEIAYLEGMLGEEIPLKNDTIDFNRISDYEKETKHEIVAFLKELSTRLKESRHRKYLHYGLTSSDVIDTCSIAMIKESLLLVSKLMLRLKNEIKQLTAKFPDLVCIGRTHGKHAEEILFSSRLNHLIFELEYIDSLISLSYKSLYGKVTGPVGSETNYVSTSGSAKALRVLGIFEEGFATQVIPRHLLATPIYVMALLATCMERFAIFIRLSSINEIDEIQEDFAEGQFGSSAMPHKNNPVMSENICGLSRLIRSNVVPALENVSLWWERDISHSSVERVIWPDTFHLTATVLEKMTQVIRTLRVNSKNIKRNHMMANCESHTNMLKRIDSTEDDRFEAYEKERAGF